MPWCESADPGLAFVAEKPIHLSDLYQVAPAASARIRPRRAPAHSLRLVVCACTGYTVHMKDFMDHIVIDPRVRSGKPCIRGTRITAYDILEYLAGGMTADEILAEFPELGRDDIQAVLQFAANRERRLASSH